jgi:beta-mannosidase
MPEKTTREPLFLAPLLPGAVELAGGWRAAFAAPGENGGAWAAPDLDDSGWEAVRLPHLRHSTVEQDTLWYRCRFQAPRLPPGGRLLLRFGGAFYETSAWLNGVELGSHQGYFQPFGFDLTPALAAGENVLAVRCRFPVEAGAFKRKTAIAGIFSDWDCKPYPSAYYPDLPDPHQWTVPIGLWQPVHLQPSGDVLVESFNVFPELDAPQWAEQVDQAPARLVLRLRNLSAEARNAALDIQAVPHNFEGSASAGARAEIRLEGAASAQLELRLAIPQARLWYPWTHGTPNLYRARLSLRCEAADPAVLEQVFGVRHIQAAIEEGRWEWRLNGRRIFPRGSNYISDFYLDRITSHGLHRDLALARQANLDLLRVHAHISAPELYRLCDEQGMLVMCDFPMIWTYAFNLSPEEQAAFQESCYQQVEEMVWLLGSHPSIALWSMHNEPPWTPDASFLGADVHETETNRLLDEQAAQRVQRADPTRPAIAGSGHFDQHLYYGWYMGSWRDNRELRPPFPTEFGVQALPELASPFWSTVSSGWRIAADDPTWAHAGYQSVFWAHPGVGDPARFSTLAEYVQESQDYQAFFVRYTIDQWRRKKFEPTGGYIHFLFTDGWPAITWSVLDYYRLPKAGYHALAQASRPTHVCIDLLDGFEVDGVFHLVYQQGAHFQANLHLVNDDYRARGTAQLQWWLEGQPGNWISRRLQRWFAPRGRVELPAADQGARLVQQVDLPLPRSGSFVFRTRLTQGGQVLDQNAYPLRVGAKRREKHVPRVVPGFLITRLYASGSLRHTEDGFAFRLRNPAMLVILERIWGLSVDHQPVDPAQVEVLRGGQTFHAASITPETPLEVPSGEAITILVRRLRLPPGEHHLEASAHIIGLGEFTARWRDYLD